MSQQDEGSDGIVVKVRLEPKVKEDFAGAVKRLPGEMSMSSWLRWAIRYALHEVDDFPPRPPEQQ